MLWNDANVIGIAGVVATIVSSATAYHYPAIFERLTWRRRLPKGLVDSWDSTWQTNEKNSDNWVVDRVKVNQKGSKITFENYDNPQKYRFRAEGKFIAPHFLLGSYESIEQPKNDGVFILLCLGDQLIGFFLGPDLGGMKNFGAWVLTKGQNKFDQAKSNLSKHAPSLHEIFCHHSQPGTGTGPDAPRSASPSRQREPIR